MSVLNHVAAIGAGAAVGLGFGAFAMRRFYKGRKERLRRARRTGLGDQAFADINLAIDRARVRKFKKRKKEDSNTDSDSRSSVFLKT